MKPRNFTIDDGSMTDEIIKHTQSGHVKSLRTGKWPIEIMDLPSYNMVISMVFYIGYQRVYIYIYTRDMVVT